MFASTCNALDITPPNFPPDPVTLAELSINAIAGINADRPLDFSQPRYFGGLSMPDPSLEAIGKTLEDRARELVGEDAAPGEYWDAVEGLAIAELDARWLDFEDGELELYLSNFLDELRQKLDLADL